MVAVSAVPRVPAVPLKLTEGDGLCVAGIRIGLVGEHVPSGRRAAGAVESAALLGGVARTGNRRRRAVRRRRHGDVEGLACGKAAEIAGGAEDGDRTDIGGCRRAAEGGSVLKESQKGRAEPLAVIAARGAHTLV